MKFEVGQWVLCRGMDWSPASWGRITRSDNEFSDIDYGGDAPHWPGSGWKNSYLEAKGSEEECRKAYRDHWDNVDYDPR